MISQTIQISAARGLRYTPWWYTGRARLANRVALVTGAGGPVGQAISVAFAREGADMLLAFCSPSVKEALETSSWVDRAGRRAVLSPLIANTEERCVEMVRLAIECFGRLDIVANTEEVAAAAGFSLPEEQTSSRSVELLFDACTAHMPAGGVITDTFFARDKLPRGRATHQALATISVLAQAGVGRLLRVNGICIGSREHHRAVCAEEQLRLPGYLAQIATAHVLCASASGLNGSILSR